MTDIMYSTEWQEHKEKHELHECSCGDTKINHAHQFPKLGCYCVTCEWSLYLQNKSKQTKETTVMFDEEVIKNLKHIKDIIKDMKTKFDHVRGDVEAREIMLDTIDRTIEIIATKS